MPPPHETLAQDIERRLAELRRFPADSLEALQVRNVLAGLVVLAERVVQGDRRLRVTRPEVTGRLRELVEQARREAVMSRTQRPQRPAPGAPPAQEGPPAQAPAQAPADPNAVVQRLIGELRRLKTATEPRDVTKRELLTARARRLVRQMQRASAPEALVTALQHQIDLMPRVREAVQQVAGQVAGEMAPVVGQAAGAAAVAAAGPGTGTLVAVGLVILLGLGAVVVMRRKE